jgi:decaprenylphospho-beta-D-ribofuranose 2-oxidase
MQPRNVSLRNVTLTGWGRISPTTASLADPDDDADVASLLRGDSPAIPRGLGRSYNNAAQCDGGVVISSERLTRILSLDAETGLVTAEAGTSLEQLMIAGLPHGWFVPVSPGTRQVSIGGAIAADVHGKNHHKAGSFAQHVRSFDLVLPGGEMRTVTPEDDPTLFWATAGGMGLTGFILRATVQLKKVETSRLLVETVRTKDIDETMALLSEHDAKYGYTVAWSDCLARGAGLGRSIVTSGDFAPASALPEGKPRYEFTYKAMAGLPSGFPPGLLNKYTIGLANRAWFMKAPKRRVDELQTIGKFFHPLDGIRNWNRAYGPAGFRQYQYVMPFGAEESVRRSYELVSAARAPSFVTVLKRFGPSDPGLLSFPTAGWTLALDFPAGTPGLLDLLDKLDELVLSVGGRVYLAKDSRVPATVFDQMYPGLDEFRKLRAEIDPAGVLSSDLSRRLNL